MDVSVLRVCVWFFSVLQAAHFARFDEFLRGAVCAAVLGKAHIVDIKTSTASLFGVFPIIHPTNIRFRSARTGRCLTAYAQHARNAKNSIAYDRPSLFISAIVAIFLHSNRVRASHEELMAELFESGKRRLTLSGVELLCTGVFFLLG